MLDLHPPHRRREPSRKWSPGWVDGLRHRLRCGSGVVGPYPVGPADVTLFGEARSPSAQQLLHTTARHPTSDVCIVTAVGEVDLFTTLLLEAVLWAELAADPAHLIVDLGGVRFLAARGVRCLLQARDIAARSGRTRLYLAGLHNQRVDRPLRLTATIELFDTHLTLDDALAAIATRPSSTSRR